MIFTISICVCENFQFLVVSSLCVCMQKFLEIFCSFWKNSYTHTHTHTLKFLYNFCDFNSRFSLFLMLSSMCCHCIISNFIWFYFIYREILDTHTHTHACIGQLVGVVLWLYWCISLFIYFSWNFDLGIPILLWMK